jgi:dTDP-4-dehydrorhamnose 3,5-epimerase
MKFSQLSIDNAWVGESIVWPDNRGFFREWFRKDEVLKATGIDFPVMQANFSLSKKGVIRGIHYSLAPEGQAKWVSCMSGSIIDVVVDLRTDSPTFKMVQYIYLEEGDGKAVLIGPGLGHGFVSNKDNSGVAYLLNSSYQPNFEFDISPVDPELKIRWSEKDSELANYVMSEKDSFAPSFKTREAKGQLPQRYNLP